MAASGNSLLFGPRKAGVIQAPTEIEISALTRVDWLKAALQNDLEIDFDTFSMLSFEANLPNFYAPENEDYYKPILLGNAKVVQKGSGYVDTKAYGIGVAIEEGLIGYEDEDLQREFPAGGLSFFEVISFTLHITPVSSIDKAVDLFDRFYQNIEKDPSSENIIKFSMGKQKITV